MQKFPSFPSRLQVIHYYSTSHESQIKHILFSCDLFVSKHELVFSPLCRSQVPTALLLPSNLKSFLCRSVLIHLLHIRPSFFPLPTLIMTADLWFGENGQFCESILLRCSKTMRKVVLPREDIELGYSISSGDGLSCRSQ